MLDKCQKAINFDLDTNALKMYYPGKHWRKAYKDIRNFLKENGFSHRQWSGYRSKGLLSDTQIIAIIKKMNKTYPWLSKCVNHFDVTNIGKTYDMLKYLSGNDVTQSKDRVKNQHKKTNTKPHSSLSRLKQVAKEQMNEINKNKTHEQNQNIIKNYNER